MNAWEQMQTPFFRDMYDRWKTNVEETDENTESTTGDGPVVFGSGGETDSLKDAQRDETPTQRR